MTVNELIEELCPECEKLSLWAIYIVNLNKEYEDDILKDFKYNDRAEAYIVCEELLKRGHYCHVVKFQGVCRDCV